MNYLNVNKRVFLALEKYIRRSPPVPETEPDRCDKKDDGLEDRAQTHQIVTNTIYKSSRQIQLEVESVTSFVITVRVSSYLLLLIIGHTGEYSPVITRE